jgi:hypothetical protein
MPMTFSAQHLLSDSVLGQPIYAGENLSGFFVVRILLRRPLGPLWEVTGVS